MPEDSLHNEPPGTEQADRLYEGFPDFSNWVEARLEDVTPELTPHFLLRLDQWIQRQLAGMLTELARESDT